jgi:hypothetical protein
MRTLKHKIIKASDFDKAFEQGVVDKHLDLTSVKARHPVQRISIDFPKNIIEELDIEATKIGVARTALIKVWVAQQLEKQHAHSG